MRVCLVCIEMFGLGTYGGFGRATRVIGRELVARDIDVCVVAPLALYGSAFRAHLHHACVHL